MATDPEQSKGDTPSPLPTESTSTLTREGSLTPQWLQPKSTNGGAPLSGAQHASRSRLGNDVEHRPDSARRGRQESLGGNETHLPKGHEKPRLSKWAPDDRESWKTKERWAAGPDSSKRWLDVQVSGRQKQGWASGDVLSRSHGDRWNTEGGRWTEERRQTEEKDYVPKNARWNDEERAERWQTGGGRGDGASRGRGHQSRGSGRRMGSEPPLASDLNGILSEAAGSGRKTLDGRSCYSKKQLVDIYDSLQAKTGPVLPLPRGVDTSYAFLFRKDAISAEDEEPPVKADVTAELPPIKAEKTGVEGIGPEELEADSWVYKDPNGQVQGPFSKQEVLAWWEEGYFPETLPVQSQVSAKENWVPLEKLLKLWDVSVDKKTDGLGRNVQPLPSVPRKLEGSDSLVTVGSHISSSFLADHAAEIPEEPGSSQPQMEMPSVMISVPPQAQVQANPPQQLPTLQNPTPDLQQTVQNLLLQRQQQKQAVANMGGLNFGNPSLGGGLSGLRPGMPFQQNHSFLNPYGLQQQQQRPLGLQDNAMLTPGILEALQQRAALQLGNRALPMQSSPYGFDLSSQMGSHQMNQLGGNASLAALLAQSQMAQRNNEQRAAMPTELQRLLQARNSQMQGNSFGGMNNPLSAGIIGSGMRPPYLQQPPQQQQNPWGSQVQGGGYSALNALLQQQQRPQQISQQQQLAQAMLLSKLQGMRLPNPQLGMPYSSIQGRDNLLNMGGLPGGDPSMTEAAAQHRQRNNMSPPNPAVQSQLDPGFGLMGQSAAPASLSQLSYGNQKQHPFPQHILQQLTGRTDPNAPAVTDVNRTASPPMLSLDPLPKTDSPAEAVARTSPVAEPRSKMGAWGVAPVTANAALLLEIQEQESKTAMQNAASKEKLTQPVATAPGGGWNVQHVKPTSLADIMQEDEETKRQQAAQSKQATVAQPTKQGSVWSKKVASAGRTAGQTISGSESGKGNVLMSKEPKSKEEHETGFWNLTTSGQIDDSCDLDTSHDTAATSEIQLFSGQFKISQQFREWCKVTTVGLGGSGDIALIEFLLSLKSRSEIADYIQEYFKEAPPDKLSVFISEFLKRKDGDVAQLRKERNVQKSRKKTSSSKSKSEVEAVTSGGAPGKARTRDAKSKPKAKKQAKGQHLPADMLGFKSSVNLDTLYRGNSNG